MKERDLQLVPRLQDQGYSREQIDCRRVWTEQATGSSLEKVGLYTIDGERMRGNIENPIGAAQMPRTKAHAQPGPSSMANQRHAFLPNQMAAAMAGIRKPAATPISSLFEDWPQTMPRPIESAMPINTVRAKRRRRIDRSTCSPEESAGGLWIGTGADVCA